MNNNKSNNTLKIVLIVIGSVVGAIIAFVCVAIFLVGMLIRGGANAISEHNQREDEEARSKTFTTYKEQREVQSARNIKTKNDISIRKRVRKNGYGLRFRKTGLKTL